MSDGDHVTGRKIKQGRKAGLLIRAGERWSMNRMVSKGFTQQVSSKQNLKQRRKQAVRTPRGTSTPRTGLHVGRLWGMACTACRHKSKSPKWLVWSEEGESTEG